MTTPRAMAAPKRTTSTASLVPASIRRLAVVWAILAPTIAVAWQTQIQPSVNFPMSVNQARAVVPVADGIVAVGALQQDFAVAKLSFDSPTPRWVRRFNGGGAVVDFNDPARLPEAAYAIAANSSGDVVAVGVVRTTATNGDAFIVKLAGATGVPIWQRQIDGSASGEDGFFAVALDANGDVVAAGQIHNAFDLDVFVVKFSGVDGTELWRRQIDGGGAHQDDLATSVAIDSQGNVVAAGVLEPVSTGTPFAVIKLDASSGTELWRRNVDATSSCESEAFAVRTLPTDDIVAAGHICAPSSNGALVVRLAGPDGSEMWRQDVPGSVVAIQALVTAPSGDIVGAGGQGGASTVAKMDSADGTLRWHQDLPISTFTANVDSHGDVFAGGDGLIKLAGVDGAQQWRYRGLNFPKLQGLTFDPANNPLGVGFLAHISLEGFMVVKLGGADGSDVLPGKQLRFVDHGSPTNRRLTIISTNAVGFPTQPDLHNNGATLQLLNPATGESEVFNLPAPKWEALAHVGYYVYKDRPGQYGPCTSVVIKAGKVFRAVCKGRPFVPLSFSLDEPAQGSLAVILTTGAGADPITTQCMQFGGAVKTDRPVAGKTSGLFWAKDAPAPQDCIFP